jgi:hypothetical protein
MLPKFYTRTDGQSIVFDLFRDCRQGSSAPHITNHHDTKDTKNIYDALFVSFVFLLSRATVVCCLPRG